MRTRNSLQGGNDRSSPKGHSAEDRTAGKKIADPAKSPLREQFRTLQNAMLITDDREDMWVYPIRVLKII